MGHSRDRFDYTVNQNAEGAEDGVTWLVHQRDTLVQATELRVLHVIPSMSPEWGGPVTALQGLTAALEEQGVQSEIATTRGWRVGESDSPTLHSAVHRFDTDILARFWTAHSRDAAKFLKNRIGEFEVVHVHEIWHYPGYVAFRAARECRIPYVLSPHGELHEEHLRQKRLKKRLYMTMLQSRIIDSADSIHALTMAEKSRIRQLGFTAPVFVSPNGVRPTHVQNSEKAVPAFLCRYPQLANKRIILFLGRMHSTKGLDVLAESFSKIADQFQDSMLLLVGPDEDDTIGRMKSALRSSGILDRVVFTGTLTGSDKWEAYQGAHMFVLPSYAEGFSISVLEAMSAGVPVVISEQCSFPEVANHGAGFVVEARERHVTTAIRALLCDDDLRGRMGQNGRRLVSERYTWPSIAASMSGLYRRVIEERRSTNAKE